MQKSLCLAFTFLIFSTSLWATSAGTTGFELFRMDGFAQNSALAGTQLSMGGELHSLFSNPAGLGEIKSQMGSVSYLKHVMDLNSGNLAYAKPIEKLGVIGIGLTYMSYGKFDKADENGQKLGDFNASDILLTVSGARNLTDKVMGGVSLKYLNSAIESESASAIAADVGFLYHTGQNNWDIGGGIYNFGFATSAYLSKNDDLPTTYKLGTSVPLEHLPVRVSLLAEYTSAEGVLGAGGLEFTFSPVIQARLGYSTIGIDQRANTSRDALAGFSAGLGLHIKSLTVDYSLSSQGEIGFLNRFTISSPF